VEASCSTGTFLDSIAQFYRRAYLRCTVATERRPDLRVARIAAVIVLRPLERRNDPSTDIGSRRTA
jgi:hypothetical protein